MSISAVKSLRANPSPHAWTTLENLIKLAAAADIPLVGGAFGVASEIVDTFNGTEETQAACNRLLRTVSTYSDTLWEFVQTMTPDVLKHSQEPQAGLARQAIHTLQRQLDKVYAIAKIHSLRGRVNRVLHQGSVRDQLDECRQSLMLSHARFQSMVSGILLTYAVKLSVADSAIQRLAINSVYGNRLDPFKITGALPFAAHEVSLFQQFPGRVLDRDHFWSDTFKARIGDKSTVAKLYYESSGGERSFVEDVKLLGRNVSSRLPRLIGHCHDSVPPYVVFEAASVMPWKQYLTEFCLSHSPEVSISKAWTLLIDLKNAVQFFVENNGIDYPKMRNAIIDARVNNNGDVLLTPIRSTTLCPIYNFPEQESGLKLLVREWVTLLDSRLAFRCIRPLVHGIGPHGNVWDILTTPKSVIRDPFVAAGLLEKWWPAQLHLREYSWPNDGAEEYGLGPNFGDVGVFDSLYPPKFRKLTNIKEDLPTYLFLGNKSHTEVLQGDEKPYTGKGCKLIQPFVFRTTVWPGEEPDEDNYEIYFYHGVPLRNKVPGYTVHMYWAQKLHASRYDSHLYFARNARNIAAKHGVKPWDLVLVTTRVHMMRSTLPPEYIQNLKRPVHAMWYLDCAVPADWGSYAYWSHSSQVFDGRWTQENWAQIRDIGMDPPPKFFSTANHPAGTRYLQFERSEFIESELNPEVDWTYKEPVEPVKPPKRSETADHVGMSVPFLGQQITMRTFLPDGSPDPDGTVFLFE